MISANVGLVSTWRMMGRLVWILMNAPLPFLVVSAASTLMAPSNAFVWMVMKPWSAILIHAKLFRVSLCILLLFHFFSQYGKFQFSSTVWILQYVSSKAIFFISAEEPFLIMADHHEIRKLSVDGSNYTILKQVGDFCMTVELWYS